MADFQFLQNPLSKQWVISAPRRSKRPDVGKGEEPVCPFCLGKEKNEEELYRVGGLPGDSNWLIRVLHNKFPFAPIHELIVHSPDHHKNFGELPLEGAELIIKTYRERYLTHQEKGQVYIFHNRGEAGGESLPHPHSQIAVVPNDVRTDIPRLDPAAYSGVAPTPLVQQVSKEEQEVSSVRQVQDEQVSNEELMEEQLKVETPHFYLFCPKTSQWPDEVWVAPKQRGRAFGEITDGEVSDLAKILTQLILIMNMRHGYEFPFNFYIYPGGDWYLRLIPRDKRLGGFEIGTGIFVNTQDPAETIKFIKEHLESPDEEKIRKEHLAEYDRVV